MSYCRWSSNDFDCDLYIYESCDDEWVIHVAGRRPLIDRSTLPPKVHPSEDVEGRFARHRAVMDLLEADHDWENIALPYVGETLRLETAAECADKVEELIALGYHVPDGVVEALREDAEAAP